MGASLGPRSQSLWETAGIGARVAKGGGAVGDGKTGLAVSVAPRRMGANEGCGGDGLGRGVGAAQAQQRGMETKSAKETANERLLIAAAQDCNKVPGLIYMST